MKRVALLLVLVFSQMATAGEGEASDPYETFRNVVDQLKAEEKQCETRLLPVPIIGNMDTAAGRIMQAIGELDVGETLLLNDPDMLTGRQAQWLNLLRTVGLRVLGMRSVDGFARTQVLVQRAEPAEGISSRIANAVPMSSPGKFSLKYFKNRRSGKIYEMLQMEPGVFAFPYYVEDRRLKVLLRPQVSGVPILDSLGEVAGIGFQPQPMYMSLLDAENPAKKVVGLLKSVIPGHLTYRIRRTETHYFNAPDTFMSPIQAVHVPLKMPVTRRIFDWEIWDGQSLLPRLQETQGADGVLELHLHLLLREAELGQPQWLGEPLTFTNLDRRSARPPPSLLFEKYKTWRRKRWFLPSESAKWNFVSADVQELNAQGGQTALSHTEFAISREGSSNIVSLLPVKKINGRVWVGLLPADSPALQARGESSMYWTVPVWRIFAGETSLEQGLKDTKGLFERRFDMEVKSLQPLGAGFRPDPATSSDMIYPYAVEVDIGEREDQHFTWYPLEQVMAKITSLRDARLMLSLFRLNQAPIRQN